VGHCSHKIKQKKILSLELKDTAGLGREHSIGVLNLLVSDVRAIASMLAIFVVTE